jgi:hypothetical protein
MGTEVIAPHILNLDTRQKYVDRFTTQSLYLHKYSPNFPLAWKLSGPQSRPKRYEGANNMSPLPRFVPWFRGCPVWAPYRLSYQFSCYISSITLLNESLARVQAIYTQCHFLQLSSSIVAGSVFKLHRHRSRVFLHHSILSVASGSIILLSAWYKRSGS